MTPDDIARMVADADAASDRCYSRHHACIESGVRCVSFALASHVRALAAECERRDLVHVNEVIALQRAVDGRGETIDSLEAELEAVTRERDEYRAALAELADIVQGHLDNGDKLDAFTLQPAREALKGGGMSRPMRAVCLIHVNTSTPIVFGRIN